MAFIGCRVTVVTLAVTARVLWRWVEVGYNLADVYARRLSGLKYKLACRYKLAADMVGVASGSSLYDVGRTEFLERERVGFGVGRYREFTFMYIESI